MKVSRICFIIIIHGDRWYYTPAETRNRPKSKGSNNTYSLASHLGLVRTWVDWASSRCQDLLIRGHHQYKYTKNKHYAPWHTPPTTINFESQRFQVFYTHILLETFFKFWHILVRVISSTSNVVWGFILHRQIGVVRCSSTTINVSLSMRTHFKSHKRNHGMVRLKSTIDA